jgi:hypothetical protein
MLLQAAIDRHGYLPQQVFSLDETGLFWKWMLTRTFGPVQEKVASGFKASKDCYMLLLGGDTSGDYKIKLVDGWYLYHSKNS